MAVRVDRPRPSNWRGAVRYLPRAGKKYQSKNTSDASSSLIPNRKDISKRSPEVDSRTTFGHWEFDTIKGRHHKGVILTLVERFSRYTLLVWASSEEAHTITADNGLECAAHEAETKALGALVYSANPLVRGMRHGRKH